MSVDELIAGLRRIMAMLVIASFIAGPLAAVTNRGGRPGQNGSQDQALTEPQDAQPRKPAGKRKGSKSTVRGIQDTAFLGQKRKYPNVPIVGITGGTVVGITIYRLRESKSAEGGEGLVRVGAERTYCIPERVSGKQRLSDGDRIRVNVDVSRVGYVYVISRELYWTGRLGKPALIFPTDDKGSASNEAMPGRGIEIPGPAADPPYFTLERTRPDQMGELLSVLITAEPLITKGRLEGELINLSAALLGLSAAPVVWESKWGRSVTGLEIENPAANERSKTEKEAGSVVTTLLSREGTHPQTLYYRLGAKSGEPIWVNLPLRYQ